MNRAATLSLAAVSAVLAASAALLIAGPIDPPPGPVAPTYRTLLEVEPRDSNVVIRNTCSDNFTNSVIIASNRYGAIVDLSSTGGGPVNGSSALSNLDSTDPNAAPG